MEHCFNCILRFFKVSDLRDTLILLHLNIGADTLLMLRVFHHCILLFISLCEMLLILSVRNGFSRTCQKDISDERFCIIKPQLA